MSRTFSKETYECLKTGYQFARQQKKTKKNRRVSGWSLVEIIGNTLWHYLPEGPKEVGWIPEVLFESYFYNSCLKSLTDCKGVQVFQEFHQRLLREFMQ